MEKGERSRRRAIAFLAVGPAVVTVDWGAAAESTDSALTEEEEGVAGCTAAAQIAEEGVVGCFEGGGGTVLGTLGVGNMVDVALKAAAAGCTVAAGAVASVALAVVAGGSIVVVVVVALVVLTILSTVYSLP